MSKKYTYSEIGKTRVCDNTGAIVAVKLGGDWFNLIGTSTEPVIIGGSYTNDENEIYKAYNRPSAEKVAIYKSWVVWARENNARLMISSHSAYFFSIIGTITDTDGTKYNLHITYANKYCKIIK